MSPSADCPLCKAWMEDAFAGELQPEQRSKMEAHLKTCEACSAVWADFQMLRRGMDVLAKETGPSRATSAKILQAAEDRLERHSGVGTFWHWLLHPATISFATLLLVAGVSLIGRQELQKRKSAETPPPVLAPQATPILEHVPRNLSVYPPSPATADRAKQEQPRLSKPSTPAALPRDKKESQDIQSEQNSLRQAPAAFDVEKRPAPAKSAPANEAAPSMMTPSTNLLGGAGSAAPPREEKAKTAKPSQPDAVVPAFEAEDNIAPAGKALQRKDSTVVGAFQELLKSAKEKIRQKNYSSALEDLLAAQKIQDSQEVQNLILLCRSHLRGDG